ncbi:hypothetical protein [Thermocoleostomius sinensis]|uniref:Uncharacterized protein n=1 Tax=Thermocoleostomius sinensis A174 TaxID=2016057 RepID=A0A9E9C8H7_9CYAN|nr:hypothetical protein [Thermocoleostomius sinensis]WAL61429.1 hypothetical protein OXH18_05410 [Thermocoleostomius sinensis A174]
MKDFATLMMRGVVGICSIVATAIVSVFVQRYLNSINGVPPAGFSPVPTHTAPTPAASAESSAIEVSPIPDDVAVPPLSEEAAIQLDPIEPDKNADATTSGESNRLQGTDRPNQIMQEFWRKLNR